MNPDRAPESMPVLSRGKHRTPRKGACFMEMASVLGGERWSDHPACTPPLLGQLGRMVNDLTSDGERVRLAVLIPSVLDLRGGDVRWAVGFATAIAVHALPDVPEPTQRALAAGLVRARQVADTLEPQPVPGTEGLAEALERVPWAVSWARQFGSERAITHQTFAARCAPTMIQCAATGTASSASSDPDGRLRALLEFGIATARRLEPVASDPHRPSATQEQPWHRSSTPTSASTETPARRWSSTGMSSAATWTR